MRVTSKGQVTIPIEIRKKLGLNDGESEVDFVEEGGTIRLVKRTADSPVKSRFRRYRGLIKNQTTMTTDDIMRLTRE